MQVETYEVAELTTDAENGAVDELQSEEALRLIESLELHGQQSLVQKRQAGDSEVVTRNPYRLMTMEEARVYGVLCPQHERVHDYDSGPIPLRVLQVAAHAQELFKSIEVWSPRDHTIPDPLLVGVESRPGQWGGREERRYLLARWGDVLLPFEELREKAAEILRASWAEKAQKWADELRLLTDRLDTTVDAFLRGRDVATPSFYAAFDVR